MCVCVMLCGVCDVDVVVDVGGPCGGFDRYTFLFIPGSEYGGGAIVGCVVVGGVIVFDVDDVVF